VTVYVGARYAVLTQYEEKVFHLCHSSRKLTGAIWLISTPCTQLSIFRRFQVCGDFYNDTKLIASWDTWGEHSIVRDTNQF
jgi:hypothetical protein